MQLINPIGLEQAVDELTIVKCDFISEVHHHKYVEGVVHENHTVYDNGLNNVVLGALRMTVK